MQHQYHAHDIDGNCEARLSQISFAEHVQSYAASHTRLTDTDRSKSVFLTKFGRDAGSCLAHGICKVEREPLKPDRAALTFRRWLSNFCSRHYPARRQTRRVPESRTRRNASPLPRHCSDGIEQKMCTLNVMSVL